MVEALSDLRRSMEIRIRGLEVRVGRHDLRLRSRVSSDRDLDPDSYLRPLVASLGTWDGEDELPVTGRQLYQLARSIAERARAEMLRRFGSGDATAAGLAVHAVFVAFGCVCGNGRIDTEGLASPATCPVHRFAYGAESVAEPDERSE